MQRRGTARLTACVILACLASAGAQSPCSTEKDAASHTQAGQVMPAISVTDSAGKTFSLADQRGKWVLVNFWATWCPPCQFEIPRLEKEIWQAYGTNPKFAMVAIAREQTTAEIVPFAKKTGFTFPIASDPKRSTYKLFADSGIPRSYLVDPQGKIVLQTVGYCPADFDAMKREIARGVAK